MKSNIRAIRFAVILCVVCSGLLSVTADYLRPLQAENVQLDQVKNILKALRIHATHTEPTPDYYTQLKKKQAKQLYSEQVVGIVISKDGSIISDKNPEDISDSDTNALPVYIHKVDGKSLAYCIPVSGKGLWSTIYGYLALENDLNTIKGLTFYQHGETPGLGGEIDKEWFLQNYTGKKILDTAGEIVSVTIMKGKAIEASTNFKHQVDGISGATLTGNGINQFLKDNLLKYNNYFSRIRESGNE